VRTWKTEFGSDIQIRMFMMQKQKKNAFAKHHLQVFYNLLVCPLMFNKVASEAEAEGSMRTISFPSLRPSNSICNASAAFFKSDKRQ
jgi:hypothetical protein